MKHDFARKLRRKQTDVERKLRFALRNRQFHGCKFRRQQPIGPYIVDFVCFESQLVIELDGSQHTSDEAAAYDKVRASYLKKDGFRILRFFNHELNVNLDGILEAIGQQVREAPLTRPAPLEKRSRPPSPTRGEGKVLALRKRRQPSKGL